MLAIGDFVSNKLDDYFDIKNREYIIYEHQVKLLKNVLDIQKGKPIFETNVCRVYMVNNKKYTFHIANNYIPLEMILLQSINNVDKVKLV